MQKIYTIANLRLNVKDAEAGRTWMLLPEGFRDPKSAKTYPLPSYAKDLLRLTKIAVLQGVRDPGVTYLKRAENAWKTKASRKLSAALAVERVRQEVTREQGELRRDMELCKKEAQEAVNTVRLEAEKQIANLSDLFALGRKGIEGQMRAHLDGLAWRDETISAKDFRECFRMVSQAVKGLGLPSDQREKAREAVMQEAAEAAEATKAALALAASTKDPEVTH